MEPDFSNEMAHGFIFLIDSVLYYFQYQYCVPSRYKYLVQ